MAFDPFSLIGGLISGGINLFNASENRDASAANNAANIAMQRETNAQNIALAREVNQQVHENNLRQIETHNRDTAIQQWEAATNRDMQREFAQMGIKWKVDDAVRAGLHPLAALGAQVSSFSPTSVGSSSLSLASPSAATVTAPRSEFHPTDLGTMGQDLSRAFQAAFRQEEKDQFYQDQVRSLSLERGELENSVLRGQVLRGGQPGTVSFPSNGVLTGRIPIPREGPIRDVSGMAVSEDDLKQKQGDIPAQKFSRPLGYRLEHNPYFSDAQSGEDRYGESEVFSTLKAIVNLAADHVYSGYKNMPGWVSSAQQFMMENRDSPSPSAEYRRRFVKPWR